MWNAGLDEAHAGIKIARRNINNLRYADDTTLMVESEQLNWFKIVKGIQGDCILPRCLFNFYAEYIMQNAELDEVKAGIKIAGRNINNFR